MSTSADRHHIAVDEWEWHRKTLYRLFVTQRKSCKEIAVYMQDHHQFRKNPRDYEYYLKKWRYRQNLRGTEWKYIGSEIERRRQLGKQSEVLLGGPTSVTRKGATTNTASSEPAEVRWWDFTEYDCYKAEICENLLAAQIHRATDSTFVNGSFQPLRDSIVSISTDCQKMVQRKRPPVEWLSSYLNKVCPEIHEGDHLSSADILLTGPRESASIELLKLAVYFLSNNMNFETTRLNGVNFLEECGLLTKRNVYWLINTCDETSEALVDALLRASLTKRDGNLLSWLLDGPINVERTISTFVWVPDYSGFLTLTLLEAAAYRGSVRCCEILLNAGVDPNRMPYEHTYFPLEYAAGNRYGENDATPLVELLLSRGATLTEPTKETILSLVVKNGNSSLALKMIQQGAKVSPRMFISATQSLAFIEMLPLLCAYPNTWTHPNLSSPTIQNMLTPKLLKVAIFKGSCKTTEVLLSMGADPNGVDSGMTPIEYICSEMRHTYIPMEVRAEMIMLLLKFGGRLDRGRRTRPAALQLAAYEGTVLLVRTVLDAGADVNVCLPEVASSLPRYRGWDGYAPTPLLTALGRSHSEVAKTILQYRPRLIGPELAEAARIGDLQLIDTLLAAGARLQGDELDYAVEYRNPAIISRLLQEGAKITERTSALEIALLLRDFEAISFELDHAAYDSICLYEATSLALKENKYLFVVEKLVLERPITIRDDLEVAALAIAVMNRSSQLCDLLSNPKFLPGS
ncbi:ankyrin repeat-containing domain protein [Hypoxylon crocopeplum]|nr:ankyrin repeat-containing domain protein [Hypoxylon crocopeplum]